jgi:hypothetical protein
MSDNSIGGFFQIDARTWAKVCVPGRMNEAVSYLVLARGTGPDNRTTSWSVDAVERYTGISRRNAKAALRRNQADGFVRLLRGGTKPKYDLVPFSELPAATPRRPLSVVEQAVVDRIARSEDINATTQRQAAYRAVEKGWLVRDGEGRFALKTVEPDWIWLPNELVTGAVSEDPPLERVRQTQDAMTLRLFIDMYHAQNLCDDGGVSRRYMRFEYERFEAGNYGQFAVWAFRPRTESMTWGNRLTDPHHRETLTDEEKQVGKNPGVDFFRRNMQLRDLGLFEWVPHLVESMELTGELIHPLRIDGSRSLEDRLGQAAGDAARAMMTAGQILWADTNSMHYLLPVLRHVANVQVVGIARLRYRPHTSMTAAWWAELKANSEKHLERYMALAADRGSQVAAG